MEQESIRGKWVVRSGERPGEGPRGNTTVEKHVAVSHAATDHLDETYPSFRPSVHASARWSEEPIRYGYHAEYSQEGMGVNERTYKQMQLFKPASKTAPVVDYMVSESPEDSSKRAMLALGILQNSVSAVRGDSVSLQPDDDLSPHSSRLAEKLTGKPQDVTNDIGFGEVMAERLPTPMAASLRQTGRASMATPSGASRSWQVASDDEVKAGWATARQAVRNSPEFQQRQQQRRDARLSSQFQQLSLFED